MADQFELALEAHRRGDYGAALAGYRAVGHLTNARHNLGALLRELGRLDEAEAALRPVVEQRPDFSPSQLSLAMVLLAKGQYAEGWARYEARRLTGHSATFEPVTAAPEWTGGDLSGRRIVVCAEQGYGDQMMFARYLPILRQRGAEVIVGCNALMRPLFDRLGYAVTPFSEQSRNIPDCDAWTLFCSLPLRLGVGAPPDPVSFVPRRSGGGVGVMPTGNPAHVNDHNRSLPQDAADQLLTLGRDLRPASTGARDFLQSADIVAGLDLVITVDTAMAHLAGSLGVPTWVLLPAIGRDWRWPPHSSSTPWYPSAHLFEQRSPDGWQTTLSELIRTLQTRPAGHT